MKSLVSYWKYLLLSQTYRLTFNGILMWFSRVNEISTKHCHIRVGGLSLTGNRYDYLYNIHLKSLATERRRSFSVITVASYLSFNHKFLQYIQQVDGFLCMSFLFFFFESIWLMITINFRNERMNDTTCWITHKSGCNFPEKKKNNRVPCAWMWYL